MAAYSRTTAFSGGPYALDNALGFQNDALRTLRFLYNYSTLHRNFLQATHKVTTVKRLLCGSFYDQRLFSQNMWASNTFNLMQQAAPTLKSELELIYGNLRMGEAAGTFSQSALRGSQLPTLLAQTSAYEESFF